MGPPDVSWSPYVWTVLVLVAAFVYVAYRVRTRPSKRVFWAGALAGLAIATIGTTAWGYHAVNVPLDDPSFFCHSPDPSPPSSIVADRILQECAAGKTITLSRGQAVAVALEAEWNVDVGTQWGDLSVANSNVLRDVATPITVPGPANSHRDFTVAVYRAYQPGEATISAVWRWCNGNLMTCDRGARWSVTIEVN